MEMILPLIILKKMIIKVGYYDSENYKKFYKDCLNKYKLNLKKVFKEIISEIEEYEKEEIDNISTLFD